MLFTRAFYSGYDISSINTTTDIVDGSVAIIMVSLFMFLGIYAHRLSYRLFVHPKFLEKMRLHSKTVMKINAAAAIAFILLGFVVVQNLSQANFVAWYRPENVSQTKTENSTDFSINPCQTSKINL